MWRSRTTEQAQLQRRQAQLFPNPAQHSLCRSIGWVLRCRLRRRNGKLHVAAYRHCARVVIDQRLKDEDASKEQSQALFRYAGLVGHGVRGAGKAKAALPEG